MKRIIAAFLSVIPIVLVVFYYEGISLRSPSSQSIRHIVFDLDGTLVESLGTNSIGDVILDSGEAYHVFDHAIELVERAYRDGLQIHFYSGGPNKRNLDLLSKLKLSDGKRFSDIASSILGKEDLVDLGEQFEGSYFTDRYRKDLTKIAPLDQLVIIEDNRYFPLNEAQRSRVVELPIHKESSLKAWREENRLTWVHGVFDQVVAGSDLKEINSTHINQNIIRGLKFVGESVDENLSRHGCAGIFYSLAF